jgi:outer membrane biosynthesis protein TonB
MRKMRSDYGLYGVAAICIILAALFAAGLVSGYTLSDPSGMIVTVVFLLIGVIAAAVGYSARPKTTMQVQEPALTPAPTPPMTPIEEPTPATEEPTTPPPPPPISTEEVSVTPEPAPSEPTAPPEPSPAMAPVEEPTPTETVAEEKPKTTRRRRKKAAA